MPGQIKRMLDSIVEHRAKGDPILVLTTKTKLMLKGVDPDRYSADAPDDEAAIAKVRALAAELGAPV